jgi:hypothetical protein
VTASGEYKIGEQGFVHLDQFNTQSRNNLSEIPFNELLTSPLEKLGILAKSPFFLETQFLFYYNQRIPKQVPIDSISY